MVEPERVLHEGKLVGIKISALADGSTPVTEESEPLQLLLLKHARGRTVAPHYHKPVERTTTHLAECLIVRKGKIRVDLYDTSGTKFKDVIVNQGETYLSLMGGIGVEYLEDSEIFEIKNGPFLPDEVKLS